MSVKTEIHPQAVLESLLSKGTRAQRQRNLMAVNEICRKQHESGLRDFSIPAIGRICEAEGVLKGRALYNAQSEDYRTLINAWTAYSGPPTPKPPKTLASHEYLMRIGDPAIRSIMQAALAERDKLRSQLNVLKAHSQVTVDRRPLGAGIITNSHSKPIAVMLMKAQLTDSERESLQNAISHDFLEDQGWHEGSHGEILNANGRVLFDVGFTLAIRKILSE